MQLSHKVGVASFNETHLTSSLCWRDPWGICCLLTNNGPGVELTQKFASNSNPRPFPGFPTFQINIYSYIITLEILEWKAPKT